MATSALYCLSYRYFVLMLCTWLLLAVVCIGTIYLLSLLFHEPFNTAVFSVLMSGLFLWMGFSTTPKSISIEEKALLVHYYGRASIRIPYTDVLRVKEHRISVWMQRLTGKSIGVELYYKSAKRISSLSFGSAVYINGEELVRELRSRTPSRHSA